MTTAAVSIVGIGCRVPGAGGGDEFWRMLLAGRDATAAPPDGRFGTRRGGYLDDVELFDNDWFALDDRETALMDPRQRLAMEVAVEAIDDAGIGYRVPGSGGAVLFGACGYSHGIAVLGRDGTDARRAVAGSGLGSVATRLSYLLDLHGPSMVLDSAGASALAAVDLAVRLLVDETVPFAIVGGVDLTLLPHDSATVAESRFRPPGGRGEPFDADKDGWVRGEGCAVVILQRTEDAVREGNRIYAEVAGTAVGANGHSNSRCAPNGRAQQDTVRATWSRAELDPHTAGYIECHGIGPAVDDAAGAGALAAVVAQGFTERVEPTGIGSVTSDIGQLEADSGIIGVIKTALSIHHGVIVPTIGFDTENPLLKTTERGPRVPTAPVDWSMVPRGDRSAGVCSVGFGGTTAHVVLRGVEATPVAHGDESPVLIPITGRDTDELRAQALRFADQLELGDASLRESVAAAARLLPEQNRLCVLARDREDAVAQLRTVARGDSGGAAPGPATTRRRGGVLFLFSGPGGQHLAMGRSLAARHSDFATALASAADAIAAAGGPRIWTPRHGFALSAGNGSSGNGSHAPEYVQPAIFAFQVAMAELLAAWGIRPDAVAGHGLGEAAAAVVSGALSLSDAALVVVRRSKSRPDLHAATALLTAAPYEAAKLVEPMRAQVGIAAINGPRSVVVSGSARYIDTLVRRAKRRNMSALRIADDSGAYTPRIAAVPPEFVEALADLRPVVPHTPMYSTVRRGELISSASLDGEYWSENASGTVELGAALESAAAAGLSTVLEVAPHPVLIPAVREHPDFHDAAHPVATRDDEAGGFLSCLARLHLEGRPVDWSAQGPFTTAAPRRAWRKRRFPLVTAVPDAAAEPFPADDLTDHMVQGAATVPAAFWLRRLLHLTRTGTGAATVLTDFVVHDRAELSVLPEVVYRRRGDGGLRAEVTAAGALASARPVGDPTPADIVAWMRVVDANRAGRHRMRIIAPAAFYDQLRCRRLEYGPRFRVLRGIATGTDTAIGLFDAAELRRTATLDGCLQLLAATIYDDLPVGVVPLPIGIDSAWLSAEPNRTVLEAHAFLRERTRTGLTGDVIGTDQHGVPCLAFSGVRIRFSEQDSPAGVSVAPRRADRAAPYFQEIWVAHDLESVGLASSEHPNAQRVLVIGGSNLAIQLAKLLDDTMPTDLIAREPDTAGPLVTTWLASTGSAPTAVVLVWPTDDRSSATASGTGFEGSAAATVGRVLELLQRVRADGGTASLTIVLPEPTAASVPPTDGPDNLAVPAAIAGLVRSLQLESDRMVRLVWVDTDTRNLPPLCRLVAAGSSDTSRLPAEIRCSAGDLAERRFTAARLRPSPKATIDTNGTYVVTGGLGAVGAVAVRWLLDAGARDVVVLTRAPRPVPPLLDGLEDRIVVVRCDAADRGDLANALNDIRHCGSTIRGLVHAAGTTENATFDAATPDQLARMLSPKLTAAGNLIELTAADPTDFILLFSAATGALGGPGQAAYAAANAAMDSLALTYPGRGVLSIGWGAWATGSQAAASHLRRAGVTAFDTRRGGALLSEALRYEGTYLCAVDYTPTTDASPLAVRMSDLLAPTAVAARVAAVHTSEGP
ncbi:SDR family NAD(P)-dependent oxidoreductase [Nocardia brasiliensis]|uniref:SDR family NAD(P)-dependent oxidoreductase n=1 Tax=Nocardia brasiliensis TaxID=37326 RepID=UPI003671D555